MKVDGDEDGEGTRMGVETNEKTQDGSRSGSGDGARTGTGIEAKGRTQDENGNGNKSSSGDGNGDEKGNGDKNEDGTREGGGEAKKRKKPRKSCRRLVGNGGDLSGTRKKCRQERFGSVTAKFDSLDNRKEAGGEAQGTIQYQGLE